MLFVSSQTGRRFASAPNGADAHCDRTITRILPSRGSVSSHTPSLLPRARTLATFTHTRPTRAALWAPLWRRELLDVVPLPLRPPTRTHNAHAASCNALGGQQSRSIGAGVCFGAVQRGRTCGSRGQARRAWRRVADLCTCSSLSANGRDAKYWPSHTGQNRGDKARHAAPRPQSPHPQRIGTRHDWCVRGRALVCELVFKPSALLRRQRAPWPK